MEIIIYSGAILSAMIAIAWLLDHHDEEAED
jgi:NADH:ubiquinone oxidoreductase subunit 6 (subunit J)